MLIKNSLTQLHRKNLLENNTSEAPLAQPQTIDHNMQFYWDGDWVSLESNSPLGDTQDVIALSDSFEPGQRIRSQYTLDTVVADRKPTPAEEADFLKSYREEPFRHTGLEDSLPIGLFLGLAGAGIGSGFGGAIGAAIGGGVGLLGPVAAGLLLDKMEEKDALAHHKIPIQGKRVVTGSLSRKGHRTFFEEDGTDRKVELPYDPGYVKKEHRNTKLGPNYYRDDLGAWTSQNDENSPLGSTNKLIEDSRTLSNGTELKISFKPHDRESEQVSGSLSREGGRTYFKPEGQDHKVRLKTHYYTWHIGYGGE